MKKIYNDLYNCYVPKMRIFATLLFFFFCLGSLSIYLVISLINEENKQGSLSLVLFCLLCASGILFALSFILLLIYFCLGVSYRKKSINLLTKQNKSFMPESIQTVVTHQISESDYRKLKVYLYGNGYYIEKILDNIFLICSLIFLVLTSKNLGFIILPIALGILIFIPLIMDLIVVPKILVKKFHKNELSMTTNIYEDGFMVHTENIVKKQNQTNQSSSDIFISFMNCYKSQETIEAFFFAYLNEKGKVDAIMIDKNDLSEQSKTLLQNQVRNINSNQYHQKESE